MKLIGVNLREEMNNEKIVMYIKSSYLNKLKQHDLIPMFITLDNFNHVIHQCNGLLITGGDDINPSYYNEVNTGQSKDINDNNDLLDAMIVSYATNNKIPLLGICRGIQSINVFSGGSLSQDIGTNHMNIFNNHEIVFHNFSFSKSKYQLVNSYHHQAIKQLAPNYQIMATHIDGTIEAIIHNSLPMIGVQWHPELLDNDIIFKYFKTLINKFY